MPALAQVNGEPVAWGNVTLPRIGLARAEFRIAVPRKDPINVAEGQAATLELIDTDGSGDVRLAYAMTAVVVGEDRGMWKVILAGGAGRIGRAIPARFYQYAPGTLVMQDILAECGERPDPAIQLEALLGRYVRRGAPAQRCVRALMNLYPDRVWRSTQTGTIWAGKEDNPAYDRVPPVVVEPQPEVGRFVLHPLLDLLPGQTLALEDHTIVCDRVTHQIGAAIRTEVWAARSVNRIITAIEHVVGTATEQTIYHALYPAEVLKDYGNQHLDCRPYLDMIPPQTKVPYEIPFPGATCEVKPGGTVMLGFENGDPSRPHAFVFRSSALKRLDIVCGQLAIRMTPDRIEIG